MKNKINLINAESDFEFIAKCDEALKKIAADYPPLDTYPSQIEVITSEQMINLYASVGMPLHYPHWSYGKKILEEEQKYIHGYSSLAYEIVINSDPCIAYMLEDNPMSLQATIIAHACYGHNSFFKNNYLFREWTHPDSIVDYLLYAKKYMMECEERYGLEVVEETLDACHALMHYGVDHYKHPRENIDNKSFIKNSANEMEPQENILYFLEKNAPLMEPWKAEIVRIIRKMAQYFYPQRQTKVMNEGWACFWHYRLMNDLYDQGYTTDEFMLEFLQNHTNVIYQPGFDDPQYIGINPYALGFNIFMDIKRICEHPTEEDKKYFPNLVHTNWLKSLDFAMKNFKDDSFIEQYLSPELMRKMHLFTIVDDDHENELFISAIHNENGYEKIRAALSQQYNINRIEPNIQIVNIEKNSDRSLTLRHYQVDRMPLYEPEAQEVMKHLYRLWQFPVKLEVFDEEEKVIVKYQCP